MISAILLAAGESRRMGQPKALLPFKETTFIAQIVAQLHAAPIVELLVVLGPHQTAIRAQLPHTVTTIDNPNYHQGMTSSLQTALRTISATSKGFLLSLVDQPHISSTVITQLITTFCQTSAGIVKPQYQQQSGHPIIVARRYVDEILQLPPDQGLNTVLRQYPADTYYLPIDSSTIIEDIDTPSDYEQYLGQPLLNIAK
jgi:molybdenum cofactor cytidylyltransferase